jgi:hypothetical protein
MKEELESILGVVVKGEDFTPLVYRLLKDSKDILPMMLKNIHLVSSVELRERILNYDSKKSRHSDTSKESNTRSSLAELLSAGHGIGMSMARNGGHGGEDPE